MKFGDKEQCSDQKSKWKSTKKEQRKHGPQQYFEVKAGKASLLLIMYCVLDTFH